MNDEDAGGPAFPEVPGTNNAFEGAHGMTLRDYFAAKAMAALIAAHGGYEDDDTSPSAIKAFSEDAPNVVTVADYAYNMADEMLIRRTV